METVSDANSSSQLVRFDASSPVMISQTSFVLSVRRIDQYGEFGFPAQYTSDP